MTKLPLNMNTSNPIRGELLFLVVLRATSEKLYAKVLMSSFSLRGFDRVLTPHPSQIHAETGLDEHNVES